MGMPRLLPTNQLLHQLISLPQLHTSQLLSLPQHTGLPQPHTDLPLLCMHLPQLHTSQLLRLSLPQPTSLPLLLTSLPQFTTLPLSTTLPQSTTSQLATTLPPMLPNTPQRSTDTPL